MSKINSMMRIIISIIIIFIVSLQGSWATDVDFFASGISPDLIKRSLVESDRVTKMRLAPQIEYQKQQENLSQSQKEKMAKMVARILETKENLRKRQWPALQISKQKAGNLVRIESVNMEFSGFIGIETSDGIIGVSPLLSQGITKNITITMNQKLDESGLAVLFKDDGDGVFDQRKDEYVTQRGRIIKEFDFESNRNHNNRQYSVIYSGSEGITVKEQMSGTKIRYGYKIYLPNSKYFVAIFKDHNQLPGRLIGVSDLKKEGVVDLTELVRDEMLYAILFYDNGDGIFDIKSDPVMKDKKGEFVMIVKFRVIND